MFCQLPGDEGCGAVSSAGPGWALASGYSGEKGALVRPKTRVGVTPDLQGKSLLWAEKRWVDSHARRIPPGGAGRALPGADPARGDRRAPIAGGRSLQPAAATCGHSSWPTPGKGGAQGGIRAAVAEVAQAVSAQR